MATADDNAASVSQHHLLGLPTINPVTVVMADASLVPPTFSGASGTDADSWVRRFTNYCEYRRLQEDERLPLFRLLLVDAAADWMQSLPREISNDFSAIQTAFRERFITDAASKSVNVATLWTRKQRQDESAEDFINSTRRLATRIPIEDEALVCHAAIQGLRDETKRFVMLRGAQTLDQVMTAARLAEATAAQAPASNDKVLRELDDLKRMFSRLVASTAADKTVTVTDVNSLTPTPTVTDGQPPKVASANPAIAVQYVVPATQQIPTSSRGRGNLRGRGRGLRRREWGPRWNPYNGLTVPMAPYGYAPPYMTPYAQTVAPQPTFANATRQPLQMSAAAQPFQPQEANATTGPMNPQMRPNRVVCSSCGRNHDNNNCPASVVQCYRCGFLGHYARCCMSQ